MGVIVTNTSTWNWDPVDIQNLWSAITGYDGPPGRFPSDSVSFVPDDFIIPLMIHELTHCVGLGIQVPGNNIPKRISEGLLAHGRENADSIEYADTMVSIHVLYRIRVQFDLNRYLMFVSPGLSVWDPNMRQSNWIRFMKTKLEPHRIANSTRTRRMVPEVLSNLFSIVY